MLNKPLYDSLVSYFGKVKIENEGVRAQIKPIPGTVSKWQLTESESHGEQYRINCPYCKDKGHHLYISYLSFSSPVVEDRQMMQADLLAICFRRNCLKDSVNRADLIRRIGMGCFSGTSTVEVSNALLTEDTHDSAYTFPEGTTLDSFKGWVPDYQPVSIDTPAEVLEYLKSRHITSADVDLFHIGWGPIKSPNTGEYITDGSPWILLPIIQHGKLKGMQARALPQHCRGSFKYWLHPGTRKKTLVGNLDNAQALGVGVVTEGFFDVYAVGAPGVCIFGHTPSSYQRMLLGSFDHGLIWLPDTDVREDLNPVETAQKECTNWNASNHFPKGAHVVQLSCKDAGSMFRSQIWQEICSQVPDKMREYLLTRVIPRL